MYNSTTGEFTSQNLNVIGIVDAVDGSVYTNPSDIGDIRMVSVNLTKYPTHSIVNSNISYPNTFASIQLTDRKNSNGEYIDRYMTIITTHHNRQNVAIEDFSLVSEAKIIYTEVSLQDLQYWGVAAIGSKNSFYVTGRRINN
jgi:hypothetical protein